MNTITTTNKILLVIILLLIGGIGGYALNSQRDTHLDSGMMSESFGTNVGPINMHRMPDGSMMGDGDVGPGHMMTMTVSSEREFIEEMIPHHQEAVDTAKEVIARGGTTSEIRQLVENIVAAQELEIAQMKEWYKAWYNESYADNGEYVNMMRELESLSGADIDRAFLQDMIQHHMGAIMMARSVQPYIEHNEITELTQAIMVTQSAEIAQMRHLLQSL